MLSKRWAFLVALFLTAPRVGFSDPGTEGAAFLEIPVGAKPAAMGSAYTALATDVYAPVWNPAGLGYASRPELTGQHLSYIEAMHYEQVGVVVPFKSRHHGVGLSAQYFGSGDIAATDPAGAPIGDFSAHYGAYGISYGRRLTEIVALGATAKFIEAKISDVSATAFAMDFGALYKADPRVTLGLTVMNLGSSLTFESQSDSLPFGVHLAAAYKPHSRWLLAAEGVGRKNRKTDSRFGVQWEPHPSIGLRAGYKTDSIRDLSPSAGVTLGAGLGLWGQEIAYAWLPFGDLGNSHYFSLTWRWGRPEGGSPLIQYNASLPEHPAKRDTRSLPWEFEDTRSLQNLLEVSGR